MRTTALAACEGRPHLEALEPRLLLDAQTPAIGPLGASPALFACPDTDWSTYLGGDDWDDVAAIATDTDGNVFVTGTTGSDGWISGGYDTTLNGGDAYVAKIAPDGQLLWSTYLGGTGGDIALDIAVDGAGNAYVVGTTNSNSWASGGLDTEWSYWWLNYDGFLAKISGNGQPMWSTYLGDGLEDEGTWRVTADASGAYILGTMDLSHWTSDYGYVGAKTLVKISADGQGVCWVRTLGEPGGYPDTSFSDIAADGQGSVFVTGSTFSPGWVSGGFDTTYNGGEGDAFLAKMSGDGQWLWSTYLGGDRSDAGSDVAVDAEGNAYVVGCTWSPGWVSGGFSTRFWGSESNGYLAKVTGDGQFCWSTYLGAGYSDFATDIAVSLAGSAFVSGLTMSTGWLSGESNYPGYNYQAFLAKVSSDGRQMLWGTTTQQVRQRPATGNAGCVIAVADPGWVYAAGNVLAPGLASGGFDTTFGGVADGYVARMPSGFVIGGHLTYKDWWGDNEDAAAVHVEVWERETGQPDYLLAEGYTDAGGRFAFSRDPSGHLIMNEDPGSGESGGRDIYFRIVAENDAAKVYSAWTNAGLDLPYEHVSDVAANCTGESLYRNFYFDQTAVTPDHAEGWGIPGIMMAAKEWLRRSGTMWERWQVGVLYPTAPNILPTTPGSFYSSAEDAIFLRENCLQDCRESTPAHEYAHAVQFAARVGKTGPPLPQGTGPDPHYLTSVSSEGFALMEGWAEFFQAAVFNDPRILGPDLETASLWIAPVPPGGVVPVATPGNIVEGAVAAILWDLCDISAWFGDTDEMDDDDVYDYWSLVWDVFLEDSPDSLWNPAGDDDFYHYWNERMGRERAVDDVFVDHGIPVRDDACEENDAGSQAWRLQAADVPVVYRDLTLSDVADWFCFTTLDMAPEGASVRLDFRNARGDLDLCLYDSAFNVVDQSRGNYDDCEGAIFAGCPAQTFYVEVTGKYGDYNPSYDLTLSVGEWFLGGNILWCGLAGDRWNDPANWSGGVVPGSDKVAVLGEAASRTVTLYQDEAVLGLDMAAPGWALSCAGSTLVIGAGGLDMGGDITSASRLDVATGNLIFDYSVSAPSPLAQVVDYTRAGYNSLTWTGNGITSSAAAADSDNLTAVGVLDNADPEAGGKTTFAGQTVDATSVLVKYTWWGDANLDGRVDANDYDLIDRNFLFTPEPDHMGWWTGDFNYDGVIDANDYDKIDRAFLFQTGPLAPAAAVPLGQATSATEPSAEADLLALAVASGTVVRLRGAGDEPGAATAPPIAAAAAAIPEIEASTLNRIEPEVDAGARPDTDRFVWEEGTSLDGSGALPHELDDDLVDVLELVDLEVPLSV